MLPSLSVGGANVMLFLYSVVNCGSCQYQDGKAKTMTWAVHFEDLGIRQKYGSKICLEILDCWSVTVVIWPGMGPVMNFELRKVQVLCLLSEQQLASKRKLFSLELVTTVYMSYKCPAYNLLFVIRGTSVHILPFCVIFCTALSVSLCKSKY